jgi:hypothetical protein
MLPQAVHATYMRIPLSMILAILCQKYTTFSGFGYIFAAFPAK